MTRGFKTHVDDVAGNMFSILSSGGEGGGAGGIEGEEGEERKEGRAWQMLLATS